MNSPLIESNIQIVRADPATEHYLTAWNDYESIPSYQMTSVVELHNRLSDAEFEEKFRKLIHDNPLLLSRFEQVNQQWFFKFDPSLPIDFRVVTLASLDELRALANSLHESYFSPFDNSALTQILYVHIHDNSYFILKVSHLIADASSLVFIMLQLTAAITQLSETPQAPLSVPHFIQSEDHIHLTSDGQGKLAWWQDYLQGHRYLQGERHQIVAGKSQHYSRRIDSETGKRLQQYSSEKGIHLATLFLYAYLSALTTIENDDDVLVSVVGANRPSGLETTVACFADWTLIRPWGTDESRKDPLASLRADLKQTKKQYIPFWYLMKQLGPAFYHHPCGLSPYQFNFMPAVMAYAGQSNGVMRWMNEIDLPATLPFFEIMCRIFPQLNHEYLIEINAHSGVVDAHKVDTLLTLIVNNLEAQLAI